jgi:hypothetical protein
MLRQLIQSARRRLLWNEALKQFALSAALAIGGVALLLTFGTRYLEWWVVALFALAVTVWAAARLRKRLPSDYAAAVWLDEKSGLHDALSTAHYFSTHGAPDARTEAVLAAQRGQAESIAGNVNVSMVVPFRFPKALYGLAALLLLSTGLVTIRYFYGHNLDLRAPITEVVFEDMAAKTPAAAKPPRLTEKQEGLEEARSLLEKLGLGANLEQAQGQKLDEALADALRGPETTPGNTEAAKFDPSMNQGDPIDQPNNTKNNTPGMSSDKSGNQKEANQDSAQNGQNGKSGEKSEKSLLSRLKEAMDNMMNSPSPGNKKSNGGKQPKPSDQADSSEQAGQQGDQQNQGKAEAEAKGATQKSNSPGQTSGNSPEKQEGPAAAGSQEGEKEIRLAEQAKAMGKISKLIGKRSEEVTGESMIEVQSGNQHVQTAYKDQSATHGEGAGEVGRDQIPLSVQAYVQQYFEEVRKPERKGAAAAQKDAPKR